MKIFLDSANLASIKTFADMGILDGVTTNPTLIAKENRGFLELVGEILRIVSGPVNLEVVSQNTEGMLHEAHDLVALAPNVVVKVPMTSEGLVAVRKLDKHPLTDIGLKRFLDDWSKAGLKLPERRTLEAKTRGLAGN